MEKFKEKFKEVNEHNSNTGADRINWRHKETFDRDYGNKALGLVCLLIHVVKMS